MLLAVKTWISTITRLMVLFGISTDVIALKTIVVGSGPGGTGFIKHALELDPVDTFIWFEEGKEENVLSWPEVYTAPGSEDYLKLTDRVTSKLLKAARWSGFGGGGMLNSGGPLTLAQSTDSRIQQAVEKYGSQVLEEELQSPELTDPTSDTWIARYKDAGYEVQAHFQTLHGTAQDFRVGYGATTFYNGTRTQVAEQVRKNPRVELHLRSPVHHIVFEINTTKAIGVELMNSTIIYADRVVLAGGVFGTYKMLINSGIGSAQDLETARVNTIVENELVGKNIGDDSGLLFLHKGFRQESNEASHGADVVALKGDQYSLTHWGKITYDALLLGTYIRPRIFSSLLRMIFQSVSMVKVDLPSKYAMSLSIRDDGSLLLDDSEDTIGETCLADNEFEVLKQARLPPILSRCLSAIMGITYLTSKKQCTSGTRLSIHHFHGGSQGILDDHFLVKNTQELYISDASVTDGYRFGAPTTNVYLIGYAVADAIYGQTQNSLEKKPSQNSNDLKV